MAEPLVLGRIDESFHQVAAAVVEEVLARLGHGVEVREGPHPEMYARLERGEVALFADSRLPGGHGTYWERIRERVVEVGALVDGARFFWAVPGYVPADRVAGRWQPQYLNEVPDLRALDDPLGGFPPPDRASLLAHRDTFGRIPERTRDVLRRIRFTVADVNAMDGAVNLDGPDPLTAARHWMDHHPGAVRTWLD